MSAGETATRREVRRRSGGYCELRIPGVCQGRATNMHHRRGAGRVWSVENVVDLCGSGTTGCHGFVTERRHHEGRTCYELGWLVHSWDDPAEIPWARA